METDGRARFGSDEFAALVSPAGPDHGRRSKPLINVVEVTTAKGATGVYTETSAILDYCIYLPVILKDSD